MDSDANVQGPAPIYPEPHAGRVRDIEYHNSNDRTIAQERGASWLRPDAIFSTKKEGRIRRRKRWRPQNSYPQPAELVGGRFYSRYLSGPRLPPRTETVTEVIVPEYAKDSFASAAERPNPLTAKDEGRVLGSQSPHSLTPHHKAARSSRTTLRARKPGPFNGSYIVPTPLPVTHGYGDSGQRADRCRQAMKERDRTTRGVLKGLSGNRGERRERGGQSEGHERTGGRNNFRAGSFTNPSTPAIKSRASWGISMQPPVREYSTIVRQHRNPRVDGSGRGPTLGLWDIPGVPSVNGAQSAQAKSPDADSNSIGGFSESWKGEEWKGEEWSDAWHGKYPRVHDNPSTSSSVDLGFWLSKSRERKRPTRFSSKKSLPTALPHSVPRVKAHRDKNNLRNGVPFHESPDPSLTTNEDVNPTHLLLSKKASIVVPASREEVIGDKVPDNGLLAKLGELLSPHQKTSQRAAPRAQSDYVLAATRIITRAGEIAPQSKPGKEKAPHTLPLDGINATHSKTSSRKVFKAALAAIKMNAKHELLSHRLAAMYPFQIRKERRRQKRLAALDDDVSGVLNPLASGEQVLVDIPAPNEQRPVSRLAHGLDRALFSQSVQWLQDPHSRVFNFPPNLQNLPSVTDFAFERLPKYLKSSMDKDLHNLALRHSKQFSGSTSSLTSFLAHIYFLISGDRRVDISTLSMAFANESRNFTPGLRTPATFTMRHRRHALDVNGDPTAGVGSYSGCGHVEQLTDTAQPPKPSELMMGNLDPNSASASPSDATKLFSDPSRRQHLPECRSTPVPNLGATSPVPSGDPLSFLLISAGLESERIKVSEPTSMPHRFFDTYAIDAGTGDPNRRRLAEQNVLLWLGTMTEKFLTLSSEEFSFLLRKNNLEKVPVRKEAYRYSKSAKFVMRSQLDCQDSRLPGTGIFDIKTRAVLPIRIDQLNFQANSGYLIRKMTGQLESFEREYYDLIRGAFLKYNFQARIGAMDGVFIAYHNTARMFGFQYVPVAEMEERLYGPGSPGRGDRVFEKCVGLMEALVAQIINCFPGQSVTCTVDAREGTQNLMLWVTPSEWPPDSRRIAEFTVTVSHTIDGNPVSSQDAIDQAHANWDLKYKIVRSRRPARMIFKAFRATQLRRFKQILPEGVSEEEMASRLANVDWGAGLGLDLHPEEASIVPDEPKPSQAARSNFASPNKYLKHLRQLALAGKADTSREDETAAHQIVWDSYPDFEAPSDPLVCEGTEQNSTVLTSLDDYDMKQANPLYALPLLTVSGEEVEYYSRLHDLGMSEMGCTYNTEPVELESALTDRTEAFQNPDTSTELWDVPPKYSVEGDHKLEATEDCISNFEQADHEPSSSSAEQGILIDKIHDVFSKYHL